MRWRRSVLSCVCVCVCNFLTFPSKHSCLSLFLLISAVELLCGARTIPIRFGIFTTFLSLPTKKKSDSVQLASKYCYLFENSFFSLSPFASRDLSISWLGWLSRRNTNGSLVFFSNFLTISLASLFLNKKISQV